MGVAWARNLLANEGTELAGWIDLDEGKASQEAQRLEVQNIHIGSDLESGLDLVQPDFVVDVTSPDAHRAVTLAALSRRIPVLGEKPMADSLASAREMVAAATHNETLYMVSQSRRYVTGLAQFREAIRSLGSLGILHVDFMLGPHFGGFRDAMDHPLLLDMAIHTFDAARYLSGLDADSVYAEAFNPSWSWYAGAASAHALFEMEEGVRFAYRGSWCAEGVPTSWEGSWRAVCSEGSATWDGGGRIETRRVIGDSGFFRELEEVAVSQPTVIEGIAGSLSEFLEALDTGATPMGECHDNIKSFAMVFASIESASVGARVPVSS